MQRGTHASVECSIEKEWTSWRLRQSNKKRSSLPRTLENKKNNENMIYFVCVCIYVSLTTDRVDSGCGSETVHKVWYQTAKKLQTEAKWKRENKDSRTKDKTEIFVIRYTWQGCTHTHTHTNPVWQLSLWVQFPDFCDGKIGWQEAGISVQDILYHLEYTQSKTLKW